MLARCLSEEPAASQRNVVWGRMHAQICCGILANLVLHAEGSTAVAAASGGGLLELLAMLLLTLDDAQVSHSAGVHPSIKRFGHHLVQPIGRTHIASRCMPLHGENRGPPLELSICRQDRCCALLCIHPRRPWGRCAGLPAVACGKR